MKTIFLTLVCCIPVACSVAEVPRLFKESSFNAAILAEAVNHFVALGEETSVRELTKLAPDHNFSRTIKTQIDKPERVGWVCRILFERKSEKTLRPPLYGGLHLPFNTMGLARWPLYPVAPSGVSFFVLSEGYFCGGVPEDPKEYLAYCRAEGVFRKLPISVPTHAQAEKDVLALRLSRAWKAIKWKDSGKWFSYTMSEADAWRFIQDQADSIK